MEFLYVQEIPQREVVISYPARDAMRHGNKIPGKLIPFEHMSILDQATFLEYYGPRSSSSILISIKNDWPDWWWCDL